VGKFGKLRKRVTSFLEVEINPVVDCLDDDLLPPPSGEEDKGKISVLLTDFL
jgi:hypothetical protein